MKTSLHPKNRKAHRSGKKNSHTAGPPHKMHQAMPARLKRNGPPEAERRALEDAINGWWWL